MHTSCLRSEILLYLNRCRFLQGTLQANPHPYSAVQNSALPFWQQAAKKLILVLPRDMHTLSHSQLCSYMYCWSVGIQLNLTFSKRRNLGRREEGQGGGRTPHLLFKSLIVRAYTEEVKALSNFVLLNGVI